MKKKHKNLSLIILLGIIIFVGCNVTPPTTTEEEKKNDLNINTLKSISVDNTSITGSGTVTYSVELDLNNVEKVRIWASLISKTSIQEDYWISYELEDISLTKTTYTGSYTFKNWEYSDDYYLELTIADYNLMKAVHYGIDAEGAPDSAFENINYTFDPWGSKIETSILINTAKTTLTGTTPDITAPVLTSITVSPDTINNTGSVKVEIDAEDALSGISDVECSLISPGEYDNDPDTDSINLEIDNMEYNSLTGKYEGTAVIRNFHEKGDWIVDYIYIEDNNGNEANYEYYNYYDTENYVLYKYENQSDSSTQTSTTIPIVKVTVN